MVVAMAAMELQLDERTVCEAEAQAKRSEALALLDSQRVINICHATERAVTVVLRGEIVGIGQEEGVVEIEVHATTQRAPCVGGPQVEVGTIAMRSTTKRLVVQTDVGLVEGG